MSPRVTDVALSGRHNFSKGSALMIRLKAGFGVEGDAHAGATVKHRSRVAVDASQANLRQVHLLGGEVLDRLVGQGFRVGPGVVGENITTRGLELHDLPRGTRLTIGTDAVIVLTGLRNPCLQLDRFQPGLMQAVLGRGDRGEVLYQCGVMGVVETDGLVQPGDPITITLPAGRHEPLRRV